MSRLLCGIQGRAAVAAEEPTAEAADKEGQAAARRKLETRRRGGMSQQHQPAEPDSSFFLAARAKTVGPARRLIGHRTRGYRRRSGIATPYCGRAGVKNGISCRQFASWMASAGRPGRRSVGRSVGQSVTSVSSGGARLQSAVQSAASGRGRGVPCATCTPQLALQIRRMLVAVSLLTGCRTASGNSNQVALCWVRSTESHFWRQEYLSWHVLTI